MCNPPFYESKADMLTSAAAKQRPAFTACTGSESEMVTQGGEVAFVSRMIDESLVLRDRVQWYTSMLGKFSSVATVVQKLRDNGIENYAVTEFIQGSKTRRWGVAWSFEDLRPMASVARGLHSLPKALLPFPSEYVIKVSASRSFLLSATDELQLGSVDVAGVGEHVDETLSRLPLKWMWKPNLCTGVGFTDKAVWSRAARRQASKEQSGDEVEDMALGFKVHIGEAEASGASCAEATIRWLKGHDSVLFESLCGMIKRKLEEAMQTVTS